MADRYDDQYSSPEALRLARALGANPQGRLTASSPDLTSSNAALAKQMAARMAAQKAAPRQEAYELARDADGNTVLVPVTPVAPKQDRNRIMEGITEGFGEQPLSGLSEQDRENYPTMSRYVDPVAKALNAVVRAPGAVVGGASGAYGAGVEAATGDTGYANAEQRRMREFLDYLGINSAARAGGPSASAPTPKVNPTTQYAMRYESIPPEGAIGPVQAPVGSARNPQMGGQVYSQNVARQAHIDDIIKQAAADTAQTRQNTSVQNLINAAAQRAREGMPRQMTADEIAAMQRSFAEANPPSASPMSLPVAAGTVVAGAMTRPGKGTPPSSAGMDRAEDEGFYRSVGAAQFPSSAGIDRNEDANFYRSVGAARLPSSAGIDQTDYPRRSPAIATAKQVIPIPPRRPADEGVFSKIFNNPVSTRELYQRSQDNPEDSGAYMRAERQYAATHRDAPSFDLTKLNEQGMKRGGSANAKPDSVHKALEIIHHLLIRGH
jgi:hypothetical protein